MRTLFFTIVLSFLYLLTFAGKGEIVFVETAVELNKNGEAFIGYTVQYKILSGEMHGFYFQGNKNLTIKKFSEESYALDDYGNKYNLEINKVGNDIWDILLANVKDISSGKITYVFYFKTDFYEAGLFRQNLFK